MATDREGNLVFCPLKGPETSLRFLFVLGILSILGGGLLAAVEPGMYAQKPAAKTPPMGWNSWDSYGLSVREPEIRANAEWMAGHLKLYGWEYLVIDEGWYLQNPESNGKPAWQFTLGQNGLYMPAPNRFPSAQDGRGFKPLADYVHSLGLKFGIHIIHGIPREAVSKNVPIGGSSFYAREAADQTDVCYWQSEASGNQPGRKIYWNSDNFGVAATEAGQAYYDSMAKLYASWGVDFIKVDCISSPYRAAEIRMLSLALKKTGRSIVLSLSPGPTPIAEADEVRKYAQMWRIANDISDFWNPAGDSQGVKGQFFFAAEWAKYAEPGHWPDGDMLPVGALGPRVSPPRQTRLTRDEQQTVLTLWSMFRSPLMIGGDLPSTDQWTTSLLTNPDVITVDQHSTGGHQVINTGNTAVWMAQADQRGEQYLAIFNIGDTRQTIRHVWKDFDLANSEYHVVNLWTHKDLGSVGSLSINLEPHACALYSLADDTPHGTQ